MMNHPKPSPHNPMPIIEQAIGALKLMQVHFDHPTTIRREVAEDTVKEAIERLQLLQPITMRLAEAYGAVRAVAPAHCTVCVAPTGQLDDHLVATILDRTVVLEQIVAKTPQGLVELLRVASEVPAA